MYILHLVDQMSPQCDLKTGYFDIVGTILCVFACK